MSNKLQLKRGLKSALPKLSAGEPAYTTDTYELFIGNGSSNVNLSGGKWYNGTQMNGTSTTAGAYYYSACPLVKVGDMYLNTSSGNVYECTTAGSGSSAKWTYRGCIRGAQGERGLQGATGVAGADGKNGTNGTNGKDGAAATITIGTVTTGAAGSSAKVVNSGTSNAAKLDFTIPRGATGAQGATGPQGPTGPQGATGSTGAKGDKDERGANATIVVAASDSSAKSKAAADYVCNSTSSQSTIDLALSALPSGGGKIVLLEGIYKITAPFTVNKNVVFEGMGDGTQINVSDSLASSTASVNVTFRDMKITANGITQYLYTGSGRVMIDNVTLNMMIQASSADAYSAFGNVAFSAVNSRITLNSTELFGLGRCFAISTSGLYTNCVINVNGTNGGRLHVGRRNATMNACDITMSQRDTNSTGIVGGIGNTMTGGTLSINFSGTKKDTYAILDQGSYMGVYIALNKSDTIITGSMFGNPRIIGCHLHNLTVNSESGIGNSTV